MTTLYDTLGVPTHATDDEIKRAYRKAAMKWHPDRNSGAEEVARATFQEIKDAYAILSDAAQRKVYDAVYAEQMRGWEAQRTRRERAQAEREAAVRAADEAAYAEMVSLAMRFADEGHNRDVLFGVLLGRRCEARRAAQIADSVAALQKARREAEAAAKVDVQGAAAETAFDSVDAASGLAAAAAAAKRGAATGDAPANRTGRGKRDGTREDTRGEPHEGKPDDPTAAAHPAGVLGGLWFQFLNGLRF
ncbi:J domain-containing protein [Paraburkholderia sp. BL21I4N1]|uniref:J domain-containing protein n=1 Tax=Paraburkholderia sp. BL21I4N1 TaxID=1938801 RepID=UPI000CFB0C5F|nr:J domain-containing protein [Paraburkholderia sp. BL21I4N1]PQV54867.1 DnaJ-like protein [Paraburkholderia sp. BL21I4N1]